MPGVREADHKQDINRNRKIMYDKIPGMREIQSEWTRTVRIVKRHRPDIKKPGNPVDRNKCQKQPIRRAAGQLPHNARYQEQRQYYDGSYIIAKTFPHYILPGKCRRFLMRL